MNTDETTDTKIPSAVLRAAEVLIEAIDRAEGGTVLGDDPVTFAAQEWANIWGLSCELVALLEKERKGSSLEQ